MMITAEQQDGHFMGITERNEWEIIIQSAKVYDHSFVVNLFY